MLLSTPTVPGTPTAGPATLTGLDRHVTALVREVADGHVSEILTEAHSLSASAFLSRVQQLRKFVAGVYGDAKRPLMEARKKLDAQQRALLDPLHALEGALTTALLTFRSASATSPSAVTLEPGALPAPHVPALVPGMSARTHVRAEVHDLRQLVLAVAAQIMLTETPSSPISAPTRRWLMAFHPTPQATLNLLRPDPAPLTALARALKDDLVIPGVRTAAATILVDRAR
jgi:hypothetical protein